MKMKTLLLMIVFGLMSTVPAWAQDAEAPADAATAETTQTEAAAAPVTEAAKPTFADVSKTVEAQLNQAVEELDALREQIAAEKIPLNRQISELESRLVDLRQELQGANRELDSRTLALANLRKSISARRDEAQYLGNLLADYLRNLEPRLHIAELQRYASVLEEARLAPENGNLSELETFEIQLSAIGVSVDRLFELLGGVMFEGTAADPEGNIEEGTFVVVGPEVLFRAKDGRVVGTADQKLGSLEPNVTLFEDPALKEEASRLAETGEGVFPFDPTLGDAHAIAEAQDTLVEHMQKGGPVMIPILLLAGVSLLIALFKWRELAMTPNPSRKKLEPLLRAVSARDHALAVSESKKLRGPIGEMLQAGAEHLGEPRELIEEVMYEKVLSSTIRLQRLLPFISICAAAAPLLGLLGTVTGIINTFEMITIFGTGDPESLSGGISEALITTKFGLIVAIPALLLYAYLSRLARGVIDSMTQAGVAFMNQIARSKGPETAPEGDAKKEAA